MWMYECEICGCRLDPGEGRICEDCLEELTGDREREIDEKELAYA